jgi:glycosyltransferase involved in cell wall biosynthesis
MRLLPGLRERGITVRCLFLLHWGTTGPALEFAKREGFEFDATLASDKTEDRVRWILDRLAANPPDVFIPNLVVAGYFAARWTREADIPTIGILHSDDAFYRAIQDEFVFGSRTSRVSAIVCVSSELEVQIRARNPEGVIVRRIPYGVPLPGEGVVRRDNSLRLAYAGRLAEEQKRIVEVTRAFCKVTGMLPGTEAVIYGDGPDRHKVEAILAHEGAGLPVRLAGAISSDKMQAHFGDCDVFVLLSEYEGLPIALLEAMSCGCVPVCRDIRSGIPEIVENGINGIVIENDDELVAAIRSLQNDPAMWRRMSIAARASIAAKFSVTASNERWARLIFELAGVPRNTSTFSIPGKLRLPPPRIPLETRENRAIRVAFYVRLFRKGRMAAGRLRRRLMRERSSL